jgi:hypothetical protein
MRWIVLLAIITACNPVNNEPSCDDYFECTKNLMSRRFFSYYETYAETGATLPFANLDQTKRDTLKFSEKIPMVRQSNKYCAEWIDDELRISSSFFGDGYVLYFNGTEERCGKGLIRFTDSKGLLVNLRSMDPEYEFWTDDTGVFLRFEENVQLSPFSDQYPTNIWNYNDELKFAEGFGLVYYISVDKQDTFYLDVP